MKLFPFEYIELTTEFLYSKKSKRSNIIYVVVLVLTIASIALTPFLNVTVTSQSRGIIRSELENNIIELAVSGRVFINNLKENKVVKAGDTLLMLDNKHIEEAIHTIEKKIALNERYIIDIENMLKYLANNLKTSKYLSEYNEYLAQINQQKLQSDYLLQEKNISDALFAKDVETKMDNRRIENNHLSSIRKEKFIHDQYHRKWTAEIAQYQQENIDLYTRLVQLNDEKSKYIIIAPINGEIIQVAGIQTGSYIITGLPLAQISPLSSLLVECYVLPSDIGLFYLDMPVNFQIDAFNYNQWGMATGKVKEISSDIVKINDQAVFKVRCSLETTHLKLKNGYKSELKKGMTLTGRFTLTQRTIAQLMFDKLDNWLNPKLVDN